MTKGRTILVGGVVMDHEVEAEGGPSRAARAGSQKNGPGKLVQAGAAKSGRRYFCRLCQSPVKVPLPRPFGERPPACVSDPHRRDLDRLAGGIDAIGDCGGQPGAHHIDHQRDREAVRRQESIGASAT
jgi:hypothetical protein